MQTRADSSAQSSQRYWLEANFNISATTCYFTIIYWNRAVLTWITISRKSNLANANLAHLLFSN